MKKTDYSNLRELLAQEIFPQNYVHKFIGNATPAFAAGVAALEAAFLAARRLQARESGGGHRYIAYTYELRVEHPDEVIRLLKATEGMADLKMIL